MGVLNATPDSFSDGGLFISLEKAVMYVRQMIDAGVDIIDIGGESTRPGSRTISEDEEIGRVIPLIEKISRIFTGPISIDTYKPAVARAALTAGASIVNDVYGLQIDPEMARVVREFKAGIIMMHNARLYRKNEKAYAGNELQPQLMDAEVYCKTELMESVHLYLLNSIDCAIKAGIEPDYMMVDPGIGFGVSAEESVLMIRQLDLLRSLHLPILIGPSRKRVIGYLTEKPVEQREFGTAAAVAIGIAKGADVVRVHNVGAMLDVLRVSDALIR